MKKQIIKKMANYSYINGRLDSKKINRITKLLKKSELKAYVKFLKVIELKKTVNVFVSDISEKNAVLQYVKKAFPNKIINITEDKSLIGGIKIVDYDMEYEYNLKNTLNSLIDFVSN